jgi:hypothetical protein
MGGGLLQLVAYGAQDAYLSGNPQITFWRGLFKRHTNFAMEPFRVNMTGQASWGTKHSAILTRYADLVSSGYIEVELPTNSDPAVTIAYEGVGRQGGFNLLEYVELDIGGQIIDRQYGEFMFLWSTLAYPIDARAKMDIMTSANLYANGSCHPDTGRPFRKNLTYIPLMFFFCRNPGAALPLIALQYHEVKINILWNKHKLVYNFDPATIAQGTTFSSGPAQANLVLDYIYLDVEERRRMAQESHEYLIEQTQFNEDKGLTSAQNRVDLTFNHPVKELIWVTQYSWRKDCRIKPPTVTGGGGVSLPVANTISPLTYDAMIYVCNLQLNGQDRTQSLPGAYFAAVQPFQHHSGTTFVDGGYPSQLLGSGNNSGTLYDVFGVSNCPGTITGPGGVQLYTMPASGGVYTYSFAIKPEEHQPSGTCNFSRIDTATLVFSIDGSKPIGNEDEYNADLRVYAINYNILRVMSGMGGLAYSN